MLFHATALAALASLAAIPAARGADIPVTVGGPNILKFDPEFVNAAVGDVVVFSFRVKNHTVTQSSFDQPCVAAAGGFNSGFQAVSSTEGPFPEARFTVSSTDPVWAYCAQGNHCTQGMVFAINPGDRFPAFQAAARGEAPPATATAPGGTAAPSVVTVTATVTAGDQTVTTTYGSYPGSAAPTSVSTTDHEVIVGGPGLLTFQPANISAQVGDTITFVFKQKNHTATQSSFSAPCRALASTSTNGQVGFDSGFMPVADGASDFPKYTIQINNTAPVWAYCRQSQPQSHCGAGMVFAVNAIESGPQNFEAYLALAKQLNGTGSDSGSGSSDSGASSIVASSSISHGIAFSVAALLLGLML